MLKKVRCGYWELELFWKWVPLHPPHSLTQSVFFIIFTVLIWCELNMERKSGNPGEQWDVQLQYRTEKCWAKKLNPTRRRISVQNNWSPTKCGKFPWRIERRRKGEKNSSSISLSPSNALLCAGKIKMSTYPRIKESKSYPTVLLLCRDDGPLQKIWLCVILKLHNMYSAPRLKFVTHCRILKKRASESGFFLFFFLQDMYHWNAWSVMICSCLKNILYLSTLWYAWILISLGATLQNQPLNHISSSYVLQ